MSRTACAFTSRRASGMADRCAPYANRQRIRVAGEFVEPAGAAAEEVGRELAALLQIARQEGGKVVCVLPIHRPNTLMEEEANTSDWNDLIISVPDLCGLLFRQGRIDAETHERLNCIFGAKVSQGVAMTNLPFWMEPSIWRGSLCPISREPKCWIKLLALVWTFVFTPMSSIKWMDWSGQVSRVNNLQCNSAKFAMSCAVRWSPDEPPICPERSIRRTRF